MEQILKQFYGIIADSINQYNSGLIIGYKGQQLFFISIDKTIGDISKMESMISSIKQKGIRCHSIISNYYGNIITYTNSKQYVLLKLECDPYMIIDLPEMVASKRKLLIANASVGKQTYNWGELWQNKVDYYERQIYSFGIGREIIINSFSYYVGLAENAINYYNLINDKNNCVCLSHNRIFFPNYWIDYGNPLSFLIDLPERDEAEYLKSSFFFNNEFDTYQEYTFLLKCKKKSPASLKVLLSRLLFPTYYFDAFENVLINNQGEDVIVEILKKSEQYEQFLVKCFKQASFITSKIDIPDWLL